MAAGALLVKNMGYAPSVVSYFGLRRPGAFNGTDEGFILMWWVALLINSMVQLAWFRQVHKRMPAFSEPQRKRFICAAVYLIGSAIRALYPVNWEARPHACLMDTRIVGRVLGGELIDRVLATIMELAIAHLVVSAISDVSLLHARSKSSALARSCFYPIVVAQAACWAGGITDNKIFHVYEECLWAASFTVLLALAVTTLYAVNQSREVGQRRLLSAIVPLITLYLTFLFVHDIPMYLSQYARDQSSGVRYNSLADGMSALLQCDAVERSFAQWQEGLPWMTATFVPGPYIAILLLEASVRSEAAVHGLKRPADSYVSDQ